MEFEFHPDAEAEVNEAAGWYEAEVAGLASDFLSEFGRALDGLLAEPERSLQIEPGIRRYLLKRFPYAIVYVIRKDRVRIVAVMHLHRKPGYWKERLE